MTTLAWPVPVPPARLTDAFGSRESFTAGEFVTGAMHGGQDFAPPVPGQRGYPVASVGAGRVVATRLGGRDANVWGGKPIYNAAAGNFVIVEYVAAAADPFLFAYGLHHLRLWVGYAHLESVHVLVGNRVPTGGRLGLMGATGAATGIHLHLDVFTDSPALGDRAFDRRIDPMRVLERRALMALSDSEQDELLHVVRELWRIHIVPGTPFPYAAVTLNEMRAQRGADAITTTEIDQLAKDIAASMPDDLAVQVADELAARLKS